MFIAGCFFTTAVKTGRALAQDAMRAQAGDVRPHIPGYACVMGAEEWMPALAVDRVLAPGGVSLQRQGAMPRGQAPRMRRIRSHIQAIGP